MFEICSHSRGRTKTLRIAVLLSILALIALVFLLSSPTCKLDSAEGRCAYIASCGWDADAESEEARAVELPEKFDAVLESYNALQLSQGYDLRAAAGRRCMQYSYDLRSFPDWDGRVIATIYVYGGRVIGGDVHTADVSGFMRALRSTAGHS